MCRHTRLHRAADLAVAVWCTPASSVGTHPHSNGSLIWADGHNIRLIQGWLPAEYGTPQQHCCCLLHSPPWAACPANTAWGPEVTTATLTVRLS